MFKAEKIALVNCIDFKMSLILIKTITVNHLFLSIREDFFVLSQHKYIKNNQLHVHMPYMLATFAFFMLLKYAKMGISM